MIVRMSRSSVGRASRLRVRIALDSNQIDFEIDSDLILEGRIEMRIDNRFFLWVVEKVSDPVSLADNTPGGNRFGLEPNRFSNRFSPNHQWYDLIWESIFDFFWLFERVSDPVSQSVWQPVLQIPLSSQKKIEYRFQISVLPSRIR